MSSREPQDWAQTLQNVQKMRKDRRESVRTQARSETPDEEFLNPDWVSSAGQSEIRQLSTGLEADLVAEPKMLVPTQPQTASVPPMLPQPPMPSVPIPDPIGQPFRSRRDDRAPPQQTRMEKACATAQVPPVPLTEDQTDIYSWMFILDCYEAMNHARRERRMAMVNQCVNLIISVLGIIGGTIAIRNGIRAASESNRR